MLDSYSYDLWGKVISGTESVPQRLRYAGSWHDQELGWYWLMTRSYDPVLARLLQRDPSQREGILTYRCPERRDSTSSLSTTKSCVHWDRSPPACCHAPAVAGSSHTVTNGR